MDRPYPYGEDDGGGGGCNGRDVRHTGTARTNARPLPDRHGGMMLGNQNNGNGTSPPTLFHSKNHERDSSVSASPTSVAALFDLSADVAVDGTSSLCTVSDAYDWQPRSVSPDSLGNGPPQLHRRHHLMDRACVTSTHQHHPPKPPPPRSVPGASHSHSTTRNRAQEDILARKLAAFDRGPPPAAPMFIPSNGAFRTPLQEQQHQQPVMIHIAPGFKARLRGAQETKACIARDFYIPNQCFSCHLDMFCIMDANYVVCPVCRVVSPLEGGADMDYQGGVGLGFTFQDLMLWQRDAREREYQQRQQQQHRRQQSFGRW